MFASAAVIHHVADPQTQLQKAVIRSIPLLAVTATQRWPLPHVAKYRFRAQCGRAFPPGLLPGELRT
jgi:hypothetical protein